MIFKLKVKTAKMELNIFFKENGLKLLVKIITLFTGINMFINLNLAFTIIHNINIDIYSGIDFVAQLFRLANLFI